MTRRAIERLAAAAVLSARQVERTADSIQAIQRPDGAIPWFAGHHLDPWDHVEAAMALDSAGVHDAAAAGYRWLAEHQNADGSWYAEYADHPRHVHQATNRLRDANFTAYVAVGCWHHHLLTSDRAFLDAHWPMVRSALDFVLDLQQPTGAIAWHRAVDGHAADEALLAGCCSIHLALRAGLALANLLGDPQPEWELALGRLRHAITTHPELFADKRRYAMDWYYPVLGTVLRGRAAAAHLAAGWPRFVVPALGVRCVDDHPWVTGGETCELAMALAALGAADTARTLLTDLGRLRADDGLYWTGYVYADDAIWPEERTSWTAASLLLALALVTGEPATTAVFRADGLPAGLDVVCLADSCDPGLTPEPRGG